MFCQITLLFDINVVLMLPWWPDVTTVQSDITIVVPWQLSTGSIHDIFCYCPSSGYSIWGTENSEFHYWKNGHHSQSLCQIKPSPLALLSQWIVIHYHPVLCTWNIQIPIKKTSPTCNKLLKVLKNTCSLIWTS